MSKKKLIMTRTEKNTLIAEFMGWTKGHPDPMELRWKNDWFTSPEDGSIRRLEPLSFDSDWNELMPVVEKIEGIIFPGDVYYNFNILGGCYVIIISSHGEELVTSDNGQSKLECTYNAAVEFIQWYNQNKQS